MAVGSTDDRNRAARGRPVYARVLRLRHIRPGSMLCFLFFEGSILIGVLLAFAELAPWWIAVLLPLTVAVMVKLNDVIAGAIAGPAEPRSPDDGAAGETPAGHAGDRDGTADRPAGQDGPDHDRDDVAGPADRPADAGAEAMDAVTAPSDPSQTRAVAPPDDLQVPDRSSAGDGAELGRVAAEGAGSEEPVRAEAVPERLVRAEAGSDESSVRGEAAPGDAVREEMVREEMVREDVAPGEVVAGETEPDRTGSDTGHPRASEATAATADGESGQEPSPH